MTRSRLAVLGLAGALTGAAHGGTPPTVIAVAMVIGCTLADDTTLRCSGADGVGQTVMWITLSDGSVVAAAYTWNVRPGVVPTLARAVHLHEGRAESMTTDLAYVWPQLRGTLSLPQGAVVVDTDLRSSRAVQGLAATGAAELTTLVRGTAVRLGG